MSYYQFQNPKNKKYICVSISYSYVCIMREKKSEGPYKLYEIIQFSDIYRKHPKIVAWL